MLNTRLRRWAPGHGSATLGGGLGLEGCSLTTACWNHLLLQAAVGREHAVEPGQVHTGFGHQGGQPGNEVEWFQDDVRGAVAKWGFQGVSHVSLCRECQSAGGHGRAGNIPAQAFELAALVGLDSDAGVQRKASSLGQLG